MPIGHGRNQRDDAGIFAIRIRIGGDPARLIHRNLGEIILADVELHEKIAQVGEGNDKPLGSAVADETGGDKFADFDIPFENCGIKGGADDGIGEIELGLGEGALELGDGGFLGVDFFLAGADLEQVELLFLIVGLGLEFFPLGEGVIELRGGYAEGSFDIDEALIGALGILHFEHGAIVLGLGLADFLRAGAGDEFSEMGFGAVHLALHLLDAGLEFVFLKPHQHLIFFDFVAHLDADPCDAADHLAGQLNAVGGDDVTGGVEGDEFIGGLRCGFDVHAEGFDGQGFGRPQELPCGDASPGEKQDQQNPRPNRAGTALGLLAFVDAKFMKFAVHALKNPI